MPAWEPLRIGSVVGQPRSLDRSRAIVSFLGQLWVKRVGNRKGAYVNVRVPAVATISLMRMRVPRSCVLHDLTARATEIGGFMVIVGCPIHTFQMTPFARSRYALFNAAKIVEKY